MRLDKRTGFFKNGSNDVETHVGPNWFFLVLLPILEAAVFLCTCVSLSLVQHNLRLSTEHFSGIKF